MAFTRYQILLSILMVVTGCINTLSVKWADRLGAIGADGRYRKFDHPFLQSCFMFLGEMLCLLTFKALFAYYFRRQVVVEDVEIIRGSQNFSPLLFLPPAMFDMIATSLMYVGLELIPASTFQMIRGSSIIFVAFLSIIFVGRKIEKHHWIGIIFIFNGLLVVGLSDVSPNDQKQDTNGVITGELLIIIAQILTACQMVYEEKYVLDKDIPPLQAVGWEGTFGLTVLGALLIPFYYIHVPAPFSNNAHGVLEDVPDAFIQMSNNYWILFGMIGTTISIAFFNFAGISITKEISVTTRVVLDSVRTFFIWMFSLAFRWQKFHFLQIVGFQLLLLGMVIYYELTSFRDFRIIRRRNNTSEPTAVINQLADEP